MSEPSTHHEPTIEQLTRDLREARSAHAASMRAVLGLCGFLCQQRDRARDVAVALEAELELLDRQCKDMAVRLAALEAPPVRSEEGLA